ncbi:MAG TPA: hypothetical protein VI670_16665 [Thermoanaerobaculia bacterium]
MAKVEGKKSRPAKKKPAPKKPAPKKKAPAKPKPQPKPKPKAKPKAKAKPAPPPPKPTRPTPAPAKPAAAKPVVAKAAAAKPAPRPPAPPKPAPAAEEKKRTRRSRPKVTSSGPATAAWFVQGGPRPSSFIPAPARAEAPSLVAAPPASSDRLVAEHELTHFAVRTVPIRVDVEAAGGRVFLNINPNEVALKVGEGIEWDFRYLGGADIIIDELVIEFDRPSPFGQAIFRSRRPGAARPHRQLSGGAQKSASGKRVQYTIRAFNGFKMELASARPWVTVS